MKQLLKKSRYTIVFLPLIALCIINAYPQSIEKSFKKIQYVYDKTGNFVEEVQFFDEQNKKLIRSFDLKENNPYKNLPYPIIKDVFLTYDLSGVKLNEIELKKGILNIRTGLPDDFDLTNGGATSYSNVYERNPDYTIITYSFNVGLGEDVGAFSAIIYVFNCKGEIIRIIDDIRAPVGYHVITNNGNYLAIGYGPMMDINSKIVSKDGCLIYNLKNNEVIEYKPPAGFGWTTPTVIDNLIVIRHENANKMYYLVFNFDTNKKYSYIFDRKTFTSGKLKDINKKGFVFEVGERNSGIYKTISYVDDFEEEVIK